MDLDARVLGVSPSLGSVAGGTTVMISGDDFTGATAVDFGSQSASSFTVNSDSQITAVAPAGTAGTVDVTVTTANGTSATSSADQFTYTAVPIVEAISTTAGPTAGGTTVTISGENLANATSVDFGGDAATKIVSDTADKIVAVSPADTAGTVDVTVTTANGTSATSSADQFTYVAPPSVSGVSPNGAVTNTGTQVTISGTNLDNATAVDFGAVSVPAADFLSDWSDQIVVDCPLANAGTVDVRVITLGGTSAVSSSDKFIFVAPPTVNGMSSTQGPMVGGTSVTFTGTNFGSITAVTVGGFTATMKKHSSTSITIVTPPSAYSGPFEVIMTVGQIGAAVLAGQFNYVASPTVTGINPSEGPLSGGVPVAITGMDLSGVTAVYFGNTRATNFAYNSELGEILAVSPKGKAGADDVTVVAAGSVSAVSAFDEYIYVAVPTITAISPASGPLNGGTKVTITGTNFSDVTQVDFGTFAANEFSVNAAGTQITAVSPWDYSAGTVYVRVASAGGTSALTSKDKFTYIASVITLVTTSPFSTNHGSKAIDAALVSLLEDGPTRK